VYGDFFGIHILFLNFLRHQTMDKVQKYNSFSIKYTVLLTLSTRVMSGLLL